jgi:hypothetical protein
VTTTPITATENSSHQSFIRAIKRTDYSSGAAAPLLTKADAGARICQAKNVFENLAFARREYTGGFIVNAAIQPIAPVRPRLGRNADRRQCARLGLLWTRAEDQQARGAVAIGGKRSRERVRGNRRQLNRCV